MSTQLNVDEFYIKIKSINMLFLCVSREISVIKKVSMVVIKLIKRLFGKKIFRKKRSWKIKRQKNC